MDNLKNIKQQFFDSLKRGTGEAYLIAKMNPTIDFSNYIIKGTLNNYAYDGQCENSRAKYIFDIISTSNKKEKIRKAVLKGLETENTNTWNLTHLFDLAKFFAQQGDEQLRVAIHIRFFENMIEGSSWVGYQQILELGGLRGLLFIAHKIGHYLEQNPDDSENSSIIEHFQESNPEIDAMEELKKISVSNSYIRTYLDNIKRTEENWEKFKQPIKEFETIINEIGATKHSYIYLRNRNLTQGELELIANKFLSEKDKFKKGQFLAIFSKYKFPFDYKPILDLAKEKPNGKNRLVEFAIEAVSFFQGNDIRQFALDKLKVTNRPNLFIEMLKNNYKNGDHKLLKSIAKKYHSEHMIEQLASSFVAIYKANKTSECIEPLLELYRKSNCGIHRHKIVEILIENNLLPDYLNEEIKFDSYEKTRQLHRSNNSHSLLF
ncbi:MAG: hypothetical protein ABI723_01280 [Bacteroidia bacterium]